MPSRPWRTSLPKGPGGTRRATGRRATPEEMAAAEARSDPARLRRELATQDLIRSLGRSTYTMWPQRRRAERW